MYPFGPLPGCAAMITLLSHDGTCCIGMNTDTLAITDPGELADDLQTGLKEVVGLQGSASPRCWSLWPVRALAAWARSSGWRRA